MKILVQLHKGLLMENNIGVLIIPFGFIFASIIAYIGYKKKWKIMDYL